MTQTNTQKTYTGSGCSINYASVKFGIPRETIQDAVDKNILPTFIRDGKRYIATYALYFFKDGREIPPFRYATDASEEDLVKPRAPRFKSFHDGLVPQGEESKIEENTYTPTANAETFEELEKELGRLFKSKDVRILTGLGQQGISNEVMRGALVPAGKVANCSGGRFFTEEELLRYLEDKMLDVKNVAAFTGVSECCIKRALQDGRAKGEKVRNHWYISGPDALNVIAKIKPRHRATKAEMEERRKDEEEQAKTQAQPTETVETQILEPEKIAEIKESESVAAGQEVNVAYSKGYMDAMRMMAVVSGVETELFVPKREEFATMPERAAYIKGYIDGTSAQA